MRAALRTVAGLILTAFLQSLPENDVCAQPQGLPQQEQVWKGRTGRVDASAAPRPATAVLRPATGTELSFSRLSPSTPPFTGFDDHENTLDARQLEKEQRFHQLYGQIRMLLDQWDQQPQQFSQITPPAAPDADADVLPPDAVDSADGDDPSAGDHSPVAGDEIPAGTVQPPLAATAGPSTEATGRFPPELLHSPTAVVDGPIDRLALANNLYATGQLTLSLQMYEQIDHQPLNQQDRHWIEYQTACCLRRLKRIPEAQIRYRRLAAQPEAGLLNEMSRWWLDRIADRTALEADLKRFQLIIESIRENFDVQPQSR